MYDSQNVFSKKKNKIQMLLLMCSWGFVDITVIFEE